MNADLVVARGVDIAVDFALVRVFSTGLTVQFEIYARFGFNDQRYALLTSNSRDSDDLTVTVNLADGRVFTYPPPTTPTQTQPDIAGLYRRGGSGSATETASREIVSLFLTPPPPRGPVTVTLSWPTFSIFETTLTLTAVALTDAAHRVITLWPDTRPTT